MGSANQGTFFTLAQAIFVTPLTQGPLFGFAELPPES